MISILNARAAQNMQLICRRVASLAVTDIASPEDLLHALGQEAPAVAARIQRLLLPSYFPNTEEGPALVAYLLRSRPAAGLAFCDFLCGAKGRGVLIFTLLWPIAFLRVKSCK